MATHRQLQRQGVRLVWPGGRVERVDLVSIGKSGGTGEVFTIQGDPRHVVKIYHATMRETQRAEYARKIEWMIANKPGLPAVPAQHRGIVQLAWPEAVALKDSRFAGFAMEKIDFDKTLELDYLLTRRQAAAEGLEVDFGKLATVCCNLAALIDCLHGRRIAVVDLKPINLKVYKSELFVSVLDCDGFHIYADGFVSEAAQVTPEYLAPEFHGRPVTNPESQDSFALGTIIFRLLNFGIHPYAGVPAPRIPYPTELSGRIKLGMYPYARAASPQVRPAPASIHDCFPDDLRELFDRTFVPGAQGRPRAADWARVLAGYASRSSGAMVACARGHLQFAGKPCPTCLREGIILGHVERRRRFITRLKASPARAITYVRRSIKGTQSSPFQAALAQLQINPPQLAPASLPIRSVISIEILWTLGLIVTYWWLR